MVKLNNQSKQEHFGSLNTFLDSKPFWKSYKSYFSYKHSFVGSKIALNKSGEILTENMKIAKTFNSYFESVTDSNHPSIIKIKQQIQAKQKNSLSRVFLRLLLEKL